MKRSAIIILLVSILTEGTQGLPLQTSNHKTSRTNDEENYTENFESNQLNFLKKYAYMIKEYQSKANNSLLESRKYNLGDASCTGCNVAVGMLQFFISLGFSDHSLTALMRDICVTFNIESGHVCGGIINLFAPEVLYILRHVSLSPSQACGFMLEDTCPDEYSPHHDWNIDIPPAKQNWQPDSKPIPKENAPRMKVLHLSDNHYDPDYTVGANGNCQLPLCCRANSGIAAVSNDKAGKWGHYGKCDTPKRTIDHLLDHIAKVHPDIDYILWTGDLPPHNVWDQSKSYNLDIIKETTSQLTKMFPNIPIFPALGNHESAPVNAFPPHYLDRDGISGAWLYNEMDQIWKSWIPENVSETVRRGAFYSALVQPGFRIISLNMNYCNNHNYWLLVNTTDPDEELRWLVDELERSEGMDEKVHIVGHIPPGNPDCLKVWSRNFYKVIKRYENTITAQFYGHTHYDEMEIFYDPDDLKRPTSIAYIGPSVTPYIKLNPGYRIYYIDGNHNETTRSVVDHETWVMNLQKANLDDNPVWYKLYSAKEAYGMQSLRPEDWNELVKSMEKKDDLFQLYYKHYFKDSPVRPMCDNICKRYLLCDIKSGRSYDREVLCGNRAVGNFEALKKARKVHKNSWTQSIAVTFHSLYNLMERFQNKLQLITNDVDPLDLYKEL